MAPTIDNIIDFCGYCGEVESTAYVTKFVNPAQMYEKDDNGNILYDENDHPINSSVYNNIITFLEAELKNARNTGKNAGTLGSLKRQLNAVKANMVEFFVGGISISDRDAVRDLVEDAVLNCRSAAANGVGFGSNIIGLLLLDKMIHDTDDSSLRATIYRILYNAYRKTIVSLYKTKYEEYEAEEIVDSILNDYNKPVDIITGDPSDIILTSIESEPMILNTISKIITIMFTSNQALLQAPNLTTYYAK